MMLFQSLCVTQQPDEQPDRKIQLFDHLQDQQMKVSRLYLTADFQFELQKVFYLMS